MNPASFATYGADPAGLICGHLIEPNAASHAIESHGAALWLEGRDRRAGLPAMNVGGVPLAQHASGFWIVVAIAGGIAFRRQRRG